MAVYSTDKTGWSQALRTAYKCATSGNYEEAIKYYKEAIKEGTNETLIHNNIADAYMNAGRLGEAVVCAEEAIDRTREAVAYVTLGEIYQAKGEHKKAVDCILKAQEIFEETVPELKDMVFDSIEEVIKKLPIRVKFELASCDWIRIIYLVKSLRTNYEKLMDYTKRGVSWEFLSDMRRKSLGQVGQRYLWSKQKLGIKGSDAGAVAKAYAAVSSIIGSPKVKVLKEEDKVAVIRITASWEYSVIKSMGLDENPGWIRCSYLCSQEYINAVVRAISPYADFKFTSTFDDGQNYCEGMVEIK